MRTDKIPGLEGNYSSTTEVLELPFVDQNGEDLGSFAVDLDQSVAEMVEEVVEESGLPKANPDGSPRRYEGFSRGRKLTPDGRVADAGLEAAAEVEVVPSVMTGLCP